MTENTGFAAFALWNALRLHFTTDYDYLKYHGKTNVTKTNFSNRKDKYSFYKLSRRYDIEELKKFYIANILAKDIQWIGDITGQDGEENFKKWQKRNQALTYNFEADIIHLFESSGNCLYVDNGNYPVLLQYLMQGDVSLETVCIMDDIMNFLPMWKKKIQDDVIWPEWYKKIVKYKPFVVFDKNRLKTVLREKYEEYAKT
jgi:hypothetical protein